MIEEIAVRWPSLFAAHVTKRRHLRREGLRLLTSVLNTRLTDHIREELGASYSPSAIVSILKEPDHLVQSYLNVTGDPSADARHCG